MSLCIIHVASGREWRGGQNQVRLLARALAKDPGLRQTVVTGRGSELAARLRQESIPVVETAWSAGIDPRALFNVWRLANATTILHAHDAHALVLAGIAAAVTGARLVVTRRVDFHLRRPGFWGRADRVIAISNAVRDVLRSDGLASTRIEVVHSGIDLQEVRSAPPALIRAQLGLAPNLPLVVNVAALVPHKDHLTLLAAAALLHRRLPDLHWVIAGEGPLETQLRNQVHEMGLADRIHFLGQVSNARGVIAEGDLFVLTSREEGLGTSVLDAMALGIPIVATQAGGIPEMLGKGAGVLVPIGDAGGLAANVELLLHDQALRERIRAAARLQVTSFTDAAMADGVRSVYRSILSTG
jgi:glycosyltransferase involved in cell wall biosynthesis